MSSRRLEATSNAASLRSRSTLRAIVVAYAVISVLWIFGSDTAVGWLVRDPKVIAVIGLVKGIIFVFCTASLFSWLLNRVAQEHPLSDRAETDEPEEGFCVDTAAIVSATLVGLAIVHVAWPKHLGSTPMHQIVAWMLVVITIVAIVLFARWVIRQGVQLTDAIRERDEARVQLKAMTAVEAHRDALQEIVRVRTSELEAERDRAENASDAKSAFVASVSHELRTPLNTIVGLAYMLNQSKLRGADAERATHINEAARHLLATVDSVLDLAKIEARKFDLTTEDFSLCAVLEAARAIVAPAAEAKGLSLVIECEPSPSLRGDATRLRQVLLNLMGNSVKFTRAGHVRVRARCEGDEEARVIVEVEDSGPGISSAMLDRIFAPFERGPYVSERNEGTGLGLYIARQFIEQMGGSVQAKSELGKGSTFTVILPFERGRERTKSESSGDPEASSAIVALQTEHAGARVLVVDDQPINCEVAEELLRSAGLDPRCAYTAEDALEKLSIERYDLVLLDAQIPETDGVAIARRIRSNPTTAALPVIAVSAAAFEEDRRACLDAGMNEFISKPIDPPTLFETILRQLEGRAGQPQPGAEPNEVVLDAERGLRSFAGKTGLFASAAAKFVATYAAGTPERDALTDADATAAARAAHRLRGVAGTLGARALVTLTVEYERDLRAERAPNSVVLLAALDELRSALSRTIVQLPERLEPRKQLDANALDHALDVLRARLLARDFEASSQCRALQGSLRARFGRAAESLIQSVDDFDYPRALAALDALRAEGATQLTRPQASR